jgi:D-arabinose 1-dehydrogenase-like Zn-dependent alcohol dehydrogenase
VQDRRVDGKGQGRAIQGDRKEKLGEVIMKAAIFKGKGAIELGERQDPTIKVPTDAIVCIALTCVCGSDLWYYRGQSEYTPGSPIGHEFLGVVEQLGDSVQNIAKGILSLHHSFIVTEHVRITG